MTNAMLGISRFEDAVKLLDEKDAEIARLRAALLALAPHHQGMSSPAGKIIAEALGIPFPLRAPYC